MAIEKINLQPEISTWRAARRGEDVRGAAISALEKTEGAVNDAIQGLDKATSDVKETTQAAVDAISTANDTTKRANETLDHADNVLTGATKQADAAAESAINSQSWAVGGTDSRDGENNDNSKYYSEKAAEQAVRAEQYANVHEPSFIIENNRLYMKQDSVLDFVVIDNRICWKIA